jgi:hypothetical protein
MSSIAITYVSIIMGQAHLSVSTLLIHSVDIGVMDKVNFGIDINRDAAVRDEFVAVGTGTVVASLPIHTELVTVAPFRTFVLVCVKNMSRNYSFRRSLDS